MGLAEYKSKGVFQILYSRAYICNSSQDHVLEVQPLGRTAGLSARV